ncbi:hypothetical protein ACW95P_00665 [Candidatus Mycoplasma pogonae]
MLKNKKKFLIIFSIFSVLVIPIVLIPYLLFTKEKNNEIENKGKMNSKDEKPTGKKVNINKYIDFDFEKNEKLYEKPSIIKTKFDFQYFGSLYGCKWFFWV